MRKNITILILLIFFALIVSTFSIASSSITYFHLESIKIENKDIEIISNEITIDTTTSKIKNTILIQNTSNEEIETDLIIPLENKELSISIKDLVIKLNDINVKYVKNDEGEYLVKTKISANSGKRINIEYSTENDLQKAKIIKCNFDNLSGRKVSKLKVNIKIDEKNIPLVENVYPGHYTFNENTISVEYYNYEVNTITKDVIVKKETFNNLLYGREVELTDEERKIINEWYTKEEVKSSNTENVINNQIAKNVVDYQIIRNGGKFQDFYEPSEPLLYQMTYKGTDGYEKDLKGKNICIDFVETEDDKELYVSKTTDIKYHEDGDEVITELVKESENKILRTKGQNTAYAGKRGAKIIFVGTGIDGENLNATEAEKIAYINQINADMYIRLEIYDGEIKYKKNEEGYKYRVGKGMVGYYDNNNSEIAKSFALCKYDELADEDLYARGYEWEYKIFYSDYKEYAKNYYNDYYKDCIIKLSNEAITNKCEVPTVVQFIGNRISKDRKYVVEFFGIEGFYDSSSRGLITTNAALETAQAKKMLATNKQKNEHTKSEAETKIENLKIVDDEQKIQEEIQEKLKQEELKIKASEENKNVNKTKGRNIENKDLIVFLCIGAGIIICIIILIVEHKRKSKMRKGEK